MTKTKKPDNTIETKNFTVEIKAEGEGIITAYAAAFGNTDSYGDVIQKGAFIKTINERKDKVKVLYNHDHYSNLPIGKAISLAEDTYGLLTSMKMSRTQMGQDIYTLAQEGALDSMSIGYSAVKATYPDDEASYKAGIYRVLTEVRLYEVSIVPFPANEGAVITGIKSGADLEREIKRWHAITELNLSTKAGRVLSAANAKKILTALNELQELVSAAGLDEPDEEAAEGTSEADAKTTADTKSSPEPRTHSSLLTALQQKARTLDTETKGSSILADLRAFGASLGGNP